MELLLQSVVCRVILVEVDDASLVFVLILVDFVGLLGLWMDALSLCTLLDAKLFQLFGAVKDCAHHNLTG